MSDRWKHDNWHTNPQQPDEHCPYCHIRALEAQLARVRELPGKWRKEELPAAAKERRYPWKRGLLKCSGELEAALDNTKSEG